MSIQEYEMIIGLEVHAELKTETKIFCGCSTNFGAEPNTQCCPVCMGMPGTLPVLNEQVVCFAVKAGLATNCEIAYISKQDRKNYFYPDLPKAYQISQYDLPLCRHGWLEIEQDQGMKRIGITRIHIEEDAGKLVHVEGKGTLIDCNRCGVPLIEIVSEPEITSGDEAKAYLQKLRAVLLYTGVSDVRMNEGSMRCDVNLSVRKKGEKKLGTRTEMKNLNSIQNVGKAIEFEFNRQVQLLESGGQVVQETRRFDAASGKTFPMRSKENANDYRYFPDPDLAPIKISQAFRASLAAEIPQLPDTRKRIYMEQYGLSAYAAEQITCQRSLADYFEQTASCCRYPKICANLLLSEGLRLLNGEEDTVPIKPEHFAAAADLLGEETINSSTCRKVIQALWKEDEDPRAFVEREHLAQIQDKSLLEAMAKEVVAEYPQAAESYRQGKTAAMQALIGQMMKKTQGKGHPEKIREALEQALQL